MKIILTAVLLLGALTMMAQNKAIPDFCSPIGAKGRCKGALKPFRYDASKTTRVTFKDKKQIKEIEVPLYMGEKYKLVFNKEGLPPKHDVVINIYDRSYKSKKRKILFTSKDYDGETQIVFEPVKSRKMYINYEVGTTSGQEKKGCIVFVLGYKIKR